MALTAARTELNVSLVGEDETIRMLEDAKKRMAELEAKTRTLTGATQAQTQAAKAQEAATGGLNATLGRMGGAIAGPLEGIGKLKEGISKGIEIFGFLGMAVNGAISAFDFLVDAFGKSEEEAKKVEEQMAATKKESERLKGSIDELQKSLVNLQGAAANAGAGLANQRAKLAQLRGDVQEAAFQTQEAAIETEFAKVDEIQGKITANVNKQAELQSMISKERTAVIAADKEIADIQKRSAEERKALKASDAAEAIKARDAARQISQRESEAVAKVRQRVADQREAVKLAQLNVEALGEANKRLATERDLQTEIADATAAQLASIVTAGAKETKPSGGGGARRGPTEDEAEAMRNELLWLRSDADERARVIKALYEEQKAREAVDKAMREATETSRVELFKTLPELQKRIQADLATLPTGAAFEAVRKQLAEQLKAVNEQMADLRALSGLDDTDLIAQATEKQLESLGKLQQAYFGLGEAKAKAREESEKMREAMARALPAEVVTNFTTGLEQLGQMQAPVFEAVQESLAGITAQMSKFKEGQTSLASAIVGSASAIAGAVAKKVGGVKAEAGVRAAFEVAMGIATAFTNPAESIGHFAAATAFGLLAGGVVKPSGGGASGGQKAPAAPAAATREGTMGGMGGSITNVYNLQTGIVDGQSTAMAFRRAEMTARNTGMASAGGW